jgi:tRNA (guanine37-N1)-methyltransferase
LTSFHQVSELVRVFCEDGRDFIKNVVARTLQEPFPAYVTPSKRMRKRKPASYETATDIAKIPIGDLERNLVSHFVMNLPDSAIQFLDAFRGIFSGLHINGRDLRGLYDTMPMIHCHCFTRELDPDTARMDIQKVRLSLTSLPALPNFSAQRVEEKLGYHLSENISFHLVRSVAPKKDMYCVSFRLPVEVAFAGL